MAHVCVQRLRPGDAQKHAAQHEKPSEAAAHEVVDPIERIDRGDDGWMLEYAMDAQRRYDDEPNQHDRAEGSPDRRRPDRLDREQPQQNRQCRGQHVALQARRDLLHSFERGQNRNRGCDRPVAINERGAKQAGGDDERPLMPLHAEQGHQRNDAALAIIVDAHGDIDVFDRRDQEQRPDDERERAQGRRLVWMRPRKVEHGLQRVERARADVAEHHAERRDASKAKSSARLPLGAGCFDRHLVSTRPSDAGSPGTSLDRGPLKQVDDARGRSLSDARWRIAGQGYPPSTLTNFGCRARSNR
jgi:hypothetical protein